MLECDYQMDLNNIGKLVTNENGKITNNELIDLVIANLSLKYTQSNNVAYAYDGQLIGLAAGQQNRVDCVKLAGEKAILWWLRLHPKVLNLNNLFVSGIKKQDKINAIIKYIQGNFTNSEYNKWTTLFTTIPSILTEKEKDQFIKTTAKSSMASDGFFPFCDNIDTAKRYGVKNIIQPGGSNADTSVINACNAYNINMFFTNNRLFYH